MAAAVIKAAAEGGKTTVDAVKKKRQRDQREAADAFVAGCAGLWVDLRQRFGHGSEAPAWAAKTLTGAARQEQGDLRKVFATYGGTKAALAWMVFCGYDGAKLDSKGRREFDPDMAFRQYAGADKSPKLFARHIVQVLDVVRMKGYAQKTELCDRLRRDLFTISFDFAPFGGGNIRTGKPQPTESTNGDQAAAATEAGGSSNVAPDARLFG